MLKILGRRSSGNTQKVLWCCDELAISYEREDAGRSYGRTRDPDYLALNPNARVPTIVDDGFALWESNAIVRYLCAKHGMGTWYPTDLKRRADMERWMDWQQTTLRPHFHALIDARDVTAEAGAATDVVAPKLEAMMAAWTILDSHMATRPYIGGERLTMADFPYCYILNRWYRLPLAHDGLPHIRAWFERLCEREAFRRNVLTQE